VKARYNGQTVYVGGPRLLEALDLEVPAEITEFEAEASRKSQTTVNLVVDEEIVAAFALADVIRPESRDAIQKLHEMGLEVAMLTGDSQAYRPVLC
jgi:Cu2+-exporting ATPase